jgi:mono/diheme cytochrome c family protein
MWRCSLPDPFAFCLLLFAFCLFLFSPSCQQYPTGGPVRLHNDMVDQPSFRPQRDPLTLPAGSIPTQGWEPALTLEQAQQIRNPVAPTRQSVEYGKKLFGIYCTPCHGASGRGDGLVGAKMVRPADITAAKYIAMKDGFFYYVIRNGSGLMPPYAESLSSSERWHVINYVRRLQRP